ncbi:PTS sugar transporter subunit IIB [Eremococcus coleocola]|uniref:PTS system, Lactose/Cellobiose specific IIB subunit n=1 Tax=Eremococcus coleocola ACS-139-V-Col8 TaxID=908337 RepID=E4KPW2_9LACT|nr:PTS sugar transporter subunit IIB [Eremococcus coleocola]EFR31015.1 PTS system, Lactose/Cellobiose specific IIB subunit [Eremococcus coleocola ACS-139-V-Col8]
MKKIYLFCSAGMSTSLVAARMQAAADAHKLPLDIQAFPIASMDTTVAETNPDMILLGPQVKFKFDETKDKYADQGIPVSVIDAKDYGNVDAERILKRALLDLKESRGK